MHSVRNDDCDHRLMPHYFFNVRLADAYIPDRMGIDLPDLDAVRREASAGARESVADRLRFGKPLRLDSVFEVTAEDGSIVHRFEFRNLLDDVASGELP